VLTKIFNKRLEFSKYFNINRRGAFIPCSLHQDYFHMPASGCSRQVVLAVRQPFSFL